MIKIEIAEESDKRMWDAIVDDSYYGTFFHTWKFLKIIEKHTNTKLYPLMGFDGEAVTGIVPLLFQKKFMFKSVFSPPPHVAVPYLGPLIVDYEKLKPYERESNFIEFQEKVNEFIAKQLKPNYIMIISPPGMIDSRPFIWSDYTVEPLYDYFLDLTQGEDYIWKRFRKDLRQGINRTIRRGVTVEEGSIEELYFIYNTLCQRYNSQNKRFHPSWEYLLDLYKTFYPQNLRVWVSYYNGKLVGGIIKILYKDKFVSWLGSPKITISGISQNDLTHWEAMKWACRNGFKYYEEVGANTRRLWFYKSKYNPEISIYFIAKKYSPSIVKLIEHIY